MKGVEVDFDEKLVTVTYDSNRTKPEVLLRAVEDAGYSPKLESKPPS